MAIAFVHQYLKALEASAHRAVSSGQLVRPRELGCLGSAPERAPSRRARPAAAPASARAAALGGTVRRRAAARSSSRSRLERLPRPAQVRLGAREVVPGAPRPRRSARSTRFAATSSRAPGAPSASPACAGFAAARFAGGRPGGARPGPRRRREPDGPLLAHQHATAHLLGQIGVERGGVQRLAHPVERRRGRRPAVGGDLLGLAHHRPQRRLLPLGRRTQVARPSRRRAARRAAPPPHPGARRRARARHGPPGSRSTRRRSASTASRPPRPRRACPRRGAPWRRPCARGRTRPDRRRRACPPPPSGRVSCGERYPHGGSREGSTTVL